jgi:hypothetical protein
VSNIGKERQHKPLEHRRDKGISTNAPWQRRSQRQTARCRGEG